MSDTIHSPKTERTEIQPEALRHAVSRMLGISVEHTTHQTRQLQGGTLGDVQLVTGQAADSKGQTQPFRIVMKTQKRWQRPGDPSSWRREYDLSQSILSSCYTPTFRAPRIYLAEINETENRLWMEYIEGASGAQLTISDLERAALELGRFQGRCHQHAKALQRIPCLGDAQFLQREFWQWSPDTVEYQCLRSDACPLPHHQQQLLIETQTNAPKFFKSLQALPQVLCHRDYWTENIFINQKQIIAIDWDTAGWGAPGEDIASLIADETDPVQLGTYYRRLVPAYYQGLSEAVPLPPISALPIREMILIKFGYRLLQQAMFSRSPEVKEQAVFTLDQINALS